MMHSKRTVTAMIWLAPLLALAQMFAPAWGQGLEGKPAPTLTLSDPAGVRQSLSGLAGGRPTIVVFWARWCPYCKALLPHLQSMMDEFGSDRLEVVAVNLWEDGPDDWREDIFGSGFDFRVLLAGDEAAKAWNVMGTPGLFLVAGDGTVVFDRNGRHFEPSRRQAVLLEGELGNPQKAARLVPLWAAELRKDVRALLAP